MSKAKGYLHRRSNDFGKLPEKLMHDQTISDGAKLLFAHMHWRYGSNGQNFEGRENMAKMLGVSEMTITKRTQELEAADWIIVVRRGKEGNEYLTNFYHVFELQEDCLRWRTEHGLPKPAPRSKKGIRQRKSRQGVGGNPRYDNSSYRTYDNSSYRTSDNLSYHYPDSVTGSADASPDPDPEDLIAPREGGASAPDGVLTPEPDLPTHSPSGDIPPAGDSPAPVGKKPTVPAVLLTPMKNAIVEAFGWQPEAMTDAMWGPVRTAARQLVLAGYSPADVPGIYQFCRRFDNPGPVALAKHAPEWKAKHPSAPVEPAQSAPAEPPPFVPVKQRTRIYFVTGQFAGFYDELGPEKVREMKQAGLLR